LRAGIVHLDRGGGGLDRREAVIVVERMKQRGVQHGQKSRGAVARDARGLAVDRVVVSPGPAARAGHHRDTIGPQQIERAHLAGGARRFEIGVAGALQEGIPAREEAGAVFFRIGMGQQRQQRMIVELGGAVIEQERHRGGALGDQPHAAIDHGVGEHAFAGQTRVIARAPACRTAERERDERRGFAFRRGASVEE